MIKSCSVTAGVTQHRREFAPNATMVEFSCKSAAYEVGISFGRGEQIMQYLVIFTPMKKFATEGMPSDFMEKEEQEQAQVRVLYAGGGLRQV